MREPDDIVDVSLGPGDWFFGDRATRIRTLLGSCVAVTVWHPRALVGGMCHYVVPSRSGPVPDGHPLEGRFGDEALLLLLHEIYRSGTLATDYEVKIFGGGSQFVDVLNPVMDVAARNVEAGLDLLTHHDLMPTSMHLGGTGHRQVVLDVWSGDVWLRHVELADQDRGGA